MTGNILARAGGSGALLGIGYASDDTGAGGSPPVISPSQTPASKQLPVSFRIDMSSGGAALRAGGGGPGGVFDTANEKRGLSGGGGTREGEGGDVK